MSPPFVTGKKLCLGLLLCTCSFAPSALLQPPTTEPVQLKVVTEHWFPFNYLDQKGEISGSSTQVIKSVFAHAGITYSLNLYPWSRAIQIATTEKNVVIFSIMRTRQREHKFQWICPLQPGMPQFVFKLTERTDIQAESLKQARGYKIGISRGSHTYELLTSLGWIEGKDFSSVTDTSQFFKLLLKGRVDLFVDTAQGMQQKLTLAGLPPDHTTSLFQLYSADLCMAASQGTDPAIIEKLRNSLKQLNSEGKH